jgi:hypothetical protein
MLWPGGWVVRNTTGRDIAPAGARAERSTNIVSTARSHNIAAPEKGDSAPGGSKVSAAGLGEAQQPEQVKRQMTRQSRNATYGHRLAIVT